MVKQQESEELSFTSAVLGPNIGSESSNTSVVMAWPSKRFLYFSSNDRTKQQESEDYRFEKNTHPKPLLFIYYSPSYCIWALSALFSDIPFFCFLIVSLLSAKPASAVCQLGGLSLEAPPPSSPPKPHQARNISELPWFPPDSPLLPPLNRLPLAINNDRSRSDKVTSPGILGPRSGAAPWLTCKPHICIPLFQFWIRS